MGSSSQPLSNQSQILSQTVSATADSSGKATFTFTSPPAGFTWTGTLTCAAAPTSTVFLATVGAVSWGDWGGNSVYGPVQVLGQGSQQLVVTATGLTPNTSFTMQWNGSSDPSDLVSAVWPDVNTSALQAIISGSIATSPIDHVTSAANNYTVSYVTPLTQTQVLAATDASLNIQITNLTAVTTYPIQGLTVQVVGSTTGLIYLNQSGITAQTMLNLQCGVYGFIENVVVKIFGPNSGASGWNVSFTLQIVASSGPYIVNQMPVVNPTSEITGILTPLAIVGDSTQEVITTYTGTLPASINATPQYTAGIAITGISVKLSSCVAGTTYTAVMNTGGVSGGAAGKQTQVFTAVNTDAYTFVFAVNLQPYPAEFCNIALSSSTGASVTATVLGTTATQISYTQQLPGTPNNDVPIGGLQSAYQATLGTANPGTQILAAPPAGYAYRLHSYTTSPQLTAGTVFLWNGLTVRYAVAFPTAQQYGSGMLNGLLVTGAVYMWANGTTPAAVTGSLFYDLVRLPYII